MMQFNEYKSSSYWLARSRRNRIANTILGKIVPTILAVIALIGIGGGVR